MRPNGGLSSSGTQNMQSSTGQYSTQAGEPAHPVQHSVITASSLGFFLRGVASPLDLGSNFISSGTIPTALVAPGAGGMPRLYLTQFSPEPATDHFHDHAAALELRKMLHQNPLQFDRRVLARPQVPSAKKCDLDCNVKIGV